MARLPWAFEKDDNGEVQEDSSYLFSALADALEVRVSGKASTMMLVMVMGLEGRLELRLRLKLRSRRGGLRSLKAASRDERDLAAERRPPQPPP